MTAPPWPAAFVPGSATFRDVELYTLIGAVLAALLGALYLRIHMLSGLWPSYVFNALCTILAGWTGPKSVLWVLFERGHLSAGSIDDMLPKAWLVLSVACGLAGTSVVNWLIYMSQTRLPGFLDRVANFVIPKPPSPP